MKASRALEAIYSVVRRIPRGRVSTYGRVAELSGLPRRARLVGRALRELPPNSDVPWHRVLNAAGRISARGDALGHEDLQAALLGRENVRAVGNAVPLARYLWQPPRPRTATKTNPASRSATTTSPAKTAATKTAASQTATRKGAPTKAAAERLPPRRPQRGGGEARRAAR